MVAHRWLGIPLSPLFVLWFASGAILLFVPYPALSPAERAAGARPLELHRLEVSPGRALATAEATGTQTTASLRLVAFQPSIPAYVVGGAAPSGEPTRIAIDATTGARLPLLGAAMAVRNAVDFHRRFGGAGAATVEGPLETDQWIVSQGFDPFRPFYRVRFDDPAGTVLYVSSRSGEIRQRTTARQRFWNWPGAVTHWIYPTFIRRHWALWDALVWWMSLAGIAVVALGAWVGIARLRHDPRAAATNRFTPFRGWLGWHHLLGIAGGFIALTWIFSGWLSMDHGRLFSTLEAPEARSEAYLGGSLREAAETVTIADLRALGPAAAIDFGRFDAAPLLSVTGPEPARSYRLRDGHLVAGGPSTLEVARALEGAWQGPVRLEGPIARGDLYGQLLESPLPEGTHRFVIDDDEGTWVHVDSRTGEIVEVMDRSRRAYRWLYNGLHSFDLPYLAQRPVLRKALILPLLAVGLALSVTSLVVGLRRLLLTVRPPRA